jgi:hypothetical protein
MSQAVISKLKVAEEEMKLWNDFTCPMPEEAPVMMTTLSLTIRYLVRMSVQTREMNTAKGKKSTHATNVHHPIILCTHVWGCSQDPMVAHPERLSQLQQLSPQLLQITISQISFKTMSELQLRAYNSSQSALHTINPSSCRVT